MTDRQTVRVSEVPGTGQIRVEITSTQTFLTGATQARTERSVLSRETARALQVELALALSDPDQHGTGQCAICDATAYNRRGGRYLCPDHYAVAVELDAEAVAQTLVDMDVYTR